MKSSSLIFRTILLCFVIITFHNCSKTDKGYTIKGNVEGFADSTMLYLVNTDIDETIDSTYVIDGEFQFSGKVEAPVQFFIHTKYERGKPYYNTSFWVENSDISIEGTVQNFKYVRVTGSKPQKIANILKKRTKPYIQKIDSLREIARKLYSNKEKAKEYRKVSKKIDELQNIRKKIIIDFIKEYPNSYEAIVNLKFLKSEIPKDTLRTIYENLDPKFRNSEHAKPIDIYLNSELVKVGEKFIDFTARTLEGSQFKLSDAIGDKYILLDFWGSMCGGCRLANKYLAREYSIMKDDLRIVSFSIDKNKQNLIKAAQEDSIQWTVVSDFKGMEGPTPIQYRVRGIPTFYIISPEGEIVEKFVGFTEAHMTKIKEIIEG